jgi:hypothetical protein
MSRQSRTKLVPPKTQPERNQALQTLEESSVPEQKEEPMITELDNEVECPLCHEIMELHSNFDKLMYSCENCSFLLKCI